MLKNYQMTGAVTATLWMTGAVFGLMTFGKSLSQASAVSFLPIAGMLMVGFVFGSLMNFSIANAFIKAPNPAYTMSILNLSASVTLIVAPILYLSFGNVFAEATINVRGLIGVLLTLTGACLVATVK